MDRIFELYDEVTGGTISYHKTLPGALKAMADAIINLTPALCRDYEDDVGVDFSLQYHIKTLSIKD